MGGHCSSPEASLSALHSSMCCRQGQAGPPDLNPELTALPCAGSGAYGVVNLVIDKQSGQELAVKLLPKVRGKLSKVQYLPCNLTVTPANRCLTAGSSLSVPLQTYLTGTCAPHISSSRLVQCRKAATLRALVQSRRHLAHSPHVH